MSSTQYRLGGSTANEISRSLEDAILEGRYAAGEALPTVRELAARLGVAPNTVAAAYRAARERGLVQTRGRNGTRVRTQRPVALRSAEVPGGSEATDLASGQPDPGLLPGLDVASVLDLSSGAAAPREILIPGLVEAARTRLRSDGVPDEAVTVAGGGLDGIRRVLTAHLRPGDSVAVEDPGWPNLLDLAAALGLRVHPIGIDASGPRPDSVRGALARGVSAVVVTTRAQNPTGVFVTAERAAELRPVFEAHPHTVLVEDDHAAELADVPLSTLAGATSAWSFVRSLSKPYGPDLRIAAVAGDKATVARIEDRLRIESGWVSTVLQRLALSMWTDPGVAETVAAGAREYDRRRTDVRGLLDQRGIESAGDTGLNVWVPVPDESHATATLLDSGFAVAHGSRFRQLSPPGIRVTVSNLADADVPALVAAIERCFAPSAGRGPTT